MTVQEFWDSGIGLLNVCAVYYVIQLLRCVLLSFPVCAIVFTLRKTVLKNRVFLKGAVWSLFIPVLFMGRMRFFYENKTGVKLFTSWTVTCRNHIWICWLYVWGVSAYAALLFYRRRKLKKSLAGMEKRKVWDTVIYVTKMPVTPSTMGVFRHKIVMPEIILKEYSREEFQTILLHEKTHIRLGHLLFYLLWDILRTLLWLNPFLTIGTKYFREDMEEICDFVTIQRSGWKAYEYGRLLLKSKRILQAENENFNMYAAFAGDKAYKSLRQRVTKIAGYRPYKRVWAALALTFAMVCVTAAVLKIHNISYGRYTEDERILVYGYDNGSVTFFDDSSALQEMISYDNNYVYVDKNAFENFLWENHAEGQIYIVFGGFVKLPGFAGGGYSCLYERNSEDKKIRLFYGNQEKNITNLFKYL